VETPGDIGNEAAVPAILRGLRDPDDGVRWQAVFAGPGCGIAPMYLPRGLSQPPRERKNPLVTGFLNPVLPCQGYLYPGRWWGVLVFQVDVTAALWLFATAGDQSTYGLLLPSTSSSRRTHGTWPGRCPRCEEGGFIRTRPGATRHQVGCDPEGSKT